MVSAAEFYPVRGSRPDVPGVLGQNIKARWTGEKRPPKAGEWFLSGAVVEAYRAGYDLAAVYHIAELVEVETKTVQVFRRVLG